MSMYSEREVKSIRKARPCDSCAKTIEAGKPALVIAGVVGGDFWSGTWHHDCRHAEVELNKLHGVYDGEDWMSLTDMEWDDWPWLIEAHPTVANRMNITTARYDERMAEQQRMREFWAAHDRKKRAQGGECVG